MGEGLRGKVGEAGKPASLWYRRDGPRTTVARSARLLNRSARACPSHAFRLKQDGQDYQDGQDRGEKGLEDLNVYRTVGATSRKGP